MIQKEKRVKILKEIDPNFTDYEGLYLPIRFDMSQVQRKDTKERIIIKYKNVKIIIKIDILNLIIRIYKGKRIILKGLVPINLFFAYHKLSLMNVNELKKNAQNIRNINTESLLQGIFAYLL